MSHRKHRHCLVLKGRHDTVVKEVLASALLQILVSKMTHPCPFSPLTRHTMWIHVPPRMESIASLSSSCNSHLPKPAGIVHFTARALHVMAPHPGEMVLCHTSKDQAHEHNRSQALVICPHFLPSTVPNHTKILCLQCNRIFHDIYDQYLGRKDF